MLNISIDQNKYEENISVITQLNSNNIYYNCSECPSVIEINKIDEEFIEFKCNNNHDKKMDIKDYLDKMKKFRNKIFINSVNYF